MKISIKSLQAGGDLPFANYIPYTGVAQSKGELYDDPRSKSGSSDEIGLQDIMKVVSLMDGLPNDMNNLVNSLTRLYRQLELGSVTGARNSAITLYLSALQKVKHAKFNLDRYNEAYKEVTKSGGLNEFAIDENGRLWGRNMNGDIKSMTVNEFLNQERNDKYYFALTNADLLKYRAEAPGFAYDNNVLDIVKNGIGLEEVTKYIQNVISHLGSDKITNEGYTAALANKIINGLDLIKSGNENLLVKYKESSQDLKDAMNLAINYLWKTLPTNAKTWLLVKSGNREDPELGGVQLMGQLVQSTTSVTKSFDMDIQENLNVDGSKNVSASSNKEHDMGSAQSWLEGHGHKSTFIILNGTQHGIPVQTFDLPITKKDNTPIGETTLNNVATSQFSGILDFSNASMGDLSIISLNDIIVDGSALYSMDLPIDLDILATTGKIVPDFKFLKNIEAANDEIRMNNIDLSTQLGMDLANAIYLRHNLPVKYTSNGLINTSNYYRFGVLNGYATLEAFGDDVELSDYVDEVYDENEVNAKVRILNGGRGEKEKKKWDMVSGWDKTMPFWNAHDTLYKGTIFIPVKNNYINAMVATGNLPSEERMDSFYEPAILDRDRYNELLRSYNPQGILR